MKTFWAGGFLYNPKINSVLLHKRDANTKFNPNAWAFFGGLNEDLETPINCFIRELNEEIGVKVAPVDVVEVCDYFNEEFQTHRYVFYVLNKMEKSEFVLGEGADFDWVAVDKINELNLTEKTLRDLKLFILIKSEMQNIVNELKKAQSQERCLRKAYDVLIAKYHGERIKTITKLFNILESDIEALWRKNGFLHCTNINYILKSLLVGSGFFKKEDVRTRWALIWYVSPHQYVQVRINDKWINVDVWAHTFGIELGDHAHGFH